MSEKHTREEILAMPAGRGLDSLVALHVMRWPRHKYGRWYKVPPDYAGNVLPDGPQKSICSSWRPSVDLAHAWEVVAKFEHNPIDSDTYDWNWPVEITRIADSEPEPGWCVRFGRYEAMAPTVAEAICKAALIAVSK